MSNERSNYHSKIQDFNLILIFIIWEKFEKKKAISHIIYEKLLFLHIYIKYLKYFNIAFTMLNIYFYVIIIIYKNISMMK